MEQLHSQTGGGRIYRATGTTWAAVSGVAGALVFGILASQGGKGQAVALLAAALSLLLAWRMWNVGIRVEPDGVKVVTFLLSRRVAWNEIDHFAVLPLGRYPYVGHVVLRDGRKFGTFGLSTSAHRSERNRVAIQRSIDALNQTLAERREVNAP